MPIRILLADDHTVVRDGLRALLERESDMTVVAEAADGRESIRLAAQETPDVVVMDLAMPNMNGMEATRRILAANSRIGVVILSMHQDESYVLGSLKAGAKGYLLKDSMRSEVVQAIRAVAEGRSFLTRKVGRIMQHAEYQPDDHRNAPLSHPAKTRHPHHTRTYSVRRPQGHHLLTSAVQAGNLSSPSLRATRFRGHRCVRGASRICGRLPRGNRRRRGDPAPASRRWGSRTRPFPKASTSQLRFCRPSDSCRRRRACR